MESDGVTIKKVNKDIWFKFVAKVKLKKSEVWAELEPLINQYLKKK